MNKILKLIQRSKGDIETQMRLVLQNLKDLKDVQWDLNSRLEDIGFDSLDTIDYIV